MRFRQAKMLHNGDEVTYLGAVGRVVTITVNQKDVWIDLVVGDTLHQSIHHRKVS